MNIIYNFPSKELPQMLIDNNIIEGHYVVQSPHNVTKKIVKIIISKHQKTSQVLLHLQTINGVQIFAVNNENMKVFSKPSLIQAVKMIQSLHKKKINELYWLYKSDYLRYKEELAKIRDSYHQEMSIAVQSI